MTIKELKKQLDDIPDDVEVLIKDCKGCYVSLMPNDIDWLYTEELNLGIRSRIDAEFGKKIYAICTIRANKEKDK